MSQLSLEQPLRAGLHSLGLATDDAQIAALIAYANLLLRWTNIHNLTAIRGPEDVLTHHLLDCLAPLPHLGANGTPVQVLDVGSGGGLPGVVWAIMRPAWRISCADSVGKKMAFVQQTAGALRLSNLLAVHTRLDAKHPAPKLAQHGYDLVTSRAFASLADFVSLTRFHVKHKAPIGMLAPWLALKGKLPQAEIDLLPHHATVKEVQTINVPGLNESRCLVWLQPVNAE